MKFQTAQEEKPKKWHVIEDNLQVVGNMVSR